MAEFLFAGTPDEGTRTATLDWRWRRTGRNRFLTREGAAVRQVLSARSLFTKHGARLHLGRGWRNHPDAALIREMLETGRLVRGRNTDDAD